MKDLSWVRAILTDFDGVLTDNCVFSGSSGEEFVKCSKYDSLGLNYFKLKYPHIPIFVFTSELNPSISYRCEKLQLSLYVCEDKKSVYISDVLQKNNIPASQSLYIGNDINDMSVFETGIRLVASPLDASNLFKSRCGLVLPKLGGNGAIRYLLEKIDSDLSKNDNNRVDPMVLTKTKSVGQREWGSEEIITVSESNYSLKRLIINRGSKGGLQFHRIKDETAILIKGKLRVNYVDSLSNQLESKILEPGDIIRFKPGCIHQEEALEDCEIYEVSNPIGNDRVKCEDLYSLPEAGGLKTTNISEIEMMEEYPV